jgi:hypothetical protein
LRTVAVSVQNARKTMTAIAVAVILACACPNSGLVWHATKTAIVLVKNVCCSAVRGRLVRWTTIAAVSVILIAIRDVARACSRLFVKQSLEKVLDATKTRTVSPTDARGDFVAKISRSLRASFVCWSSSSPLGARRKKEPAKRGAGRRAGRERNAYIYRNTTILLVHYFHNLSCKSLDYIV